MSKDTIYRQDAIDALDCINGAEEVLRRLPSAQPERWILCSQRLPKSGKEVFVYLWDNVPYLASVDDKGRWETERFYLDADDTPKAWMPLPKPYAERRTDDLQ